MSEREKSRKALFFLRWYKREKTPDSTENLKKYA